MCLTWCVGYCNPQLTSPACVIVSAHPGRANGYNVAVGGLVAAGVVPRQSRQQLVCRCVVQRQRSAAAVALELWHYMFRTSPCKLLR